MRIPTRTALVFAALAMMTGCSNITKPEPVAVAVEPVFVEPPVIQNPPPPPPPPRPTPVVISEDVITPEAVVVPEEVVVVEQSAVVAAVRTPASVETSAEFATASADPLPAIRASRSFAGPTQFPPENFAAYGILAFPDNPASTEALSSRFDTFCKAFMGGISTVEELVVSGVAIDAQMVTVMPVSSDEISAAAKTAANTTAACAIARDNYGTLAARTSIAEANRASELTDGIEQLDGRGPFLIAWSPGETKGARDAIVLVTDLTNSVSEEQIASDIRLWVETIQQEPDLWRRGWNVEGLRLAGQRWIDRRAAGILKILGGG